MSSIYEVVAQEVVNAVSSKYELDDEEFKGDLFSLIVESLKNHKLQAPTQTTDGAPDTTARKPRKPRKPRAPKEAGKKTKRSGYNLFVQDEMKSEAAKALVPTSRMGHCAGVWKEMSDEQKQVWKDRATELNLATEAETAPVAPSDGATSETMTEVSVTA